MDSGGFADTQVESTTQRGHDSLGRDRGTKGGHTSWAGRKRLAPEGDREEVVKVTPGRKCCRGDRGARGFQKEEAGRGIECHRGQAGSNCSLCHFGIRRIEEAVTSYLG